MSDQSPSTFHEEIMLLAEKMGELHDRFAKIETEFSAQTAPLDAAKSTQDSALVALNAALEGIKQLNFHVLDNNLGAVSKRVDEVGKQADTAIQALDDKLDQEALARGEAIVVMDKKLAQLEATRVELAKTRDQDTKQFSTRLSKLNQEIAYARETLAEQLQAAIKQFATPAGLNPRGKWNPQDTYARLDIVSLNGSSYVSMADNNKEKPGRGSKLWGLLASRGGSALGGGATDITGVAGIGATGLLLVQSATESDARDILGVNDFTGATSGADGTAGRVIKPSAGDQTKYLRGDGTWTTPSTVTAPAASQSEVDAGTEDAKYVNPVTLHGYVEPLVNQRQPAPRILSDGATTNRAIIGQFGDVGDLAGSPATFAIPITVPTSNPSATIYLIHNGTSTTSPATDTNRFSVYITASGLLGIANIGAPTSNNRIMSDASFRADYSGQSVRLVITFPSGDSTTDPTIHCNGVDISASFGASVPSGTPPNWMDANMVSTNFMCGYRMPSGDAPIARLYNYAWSDADALAWSGGGAMPADAEKAGSQSDDSLAGLDWRNGSSAPDTLTFTGMAITSCIDNGAGTAQAVLDGTFSLKAGRKYKVIIPNATLNSGSWPELKTGSDIALTTAGGLNIVGYAGESSVIFTASTSATSIRIGWRITAACDFSHGDMQIVPIGAIDDPIIQPGLTTGDKHGRFSRRLLGMKSVPHTDRGQIIINTAAAADTQALGGPVFDNTTDYVLDGPIEQVPDGGTPDTDIGSTSGGVDYKATSTLASGVNPFTAATRKVGATSIYVGSDDTTPLRTFIPFRKISTP